MLQATLIPPAAYRVMPWRNGQGTTTEIAIAAGDGGRFRWRLSIADVAASGPFSDFAGYDRVIAVVSGAGMRLAVAGRPPVALTQDSAPYPFSGDAATECVLLDGPIRDFNLMADRAVCRGAVRALRFAGRPIDQEIGNGVTALLHAVRGAVSVLGASSEERLVPEGATLRLDGVSGALRIALAPGGLALLATIAALP